MIANNTIFLMCENLSLAEKKTMLHNNVCSVLFVCFFGVWTERKLT